MAAMVLLLRIETLQQKPSTTNVGSIFNLNMLLPTLDKSYYQKSQKVATMALALKIEIFNENQIPPNLFKFEHAPVDILNS